VEKVFIFDTIHQVLLKSAEFYRRYDKSLAYILLRHNDTIETRPFTSHGHWPAFQRNGVTEPENRPLSSPDFKRVNLRLVYC